MSRSENASGAAQPWQFTKEAALQGMQLPLEQGLLFECESFQVLCATAGKTEGIRARPGKAGPQFTALGLKAPFALRYQAEGG